MWKCKPFGWLWGLPLLALLGLMVLFGERRNIEADLSDRVSGELGNAGLGWAKLGFVGRDGTLTGTAGSVGERESAIALAERTWGVRIVDASVDMQQAVSPYTWSAVRQGGKLTLGGYIPAEADRAAIVSTARSQLPGLEIVDQLKVAAGAPAHGVYLNGVGFGLEQLACLEPGSTGLSDANFNIEGLASSQDCYAGVSKAVDSALPQGLKLASRNITAPKLPEPAPAPAPAAVAPAPAPVAAAPAPAPAPAIHPYVWRADYYSNRLTLSGNIPDEATREAIKAKAKERFASSEIIDQMEVGNGAPADWTAAAAASLGELANLQVGSATVWDNDVTLRGRAESEARKTEVLGRIDGELPGGYHSLSHDISVPEPAPAPAAEALVAAPPVVAVKEAELQAATPLKVDECQTYLNSILATNSVLFKVASAELEPGSFATLVGLAHVAKRCPETRIEIAGHTDSDGSVRFNEMLSLRRARSVVQYLTQEGVAADRLSAVGYGKARPIAPNTSPENKAKNRRIEFSVKEF
jgi:OOP family OmpA-OmpF porin